jgi:D-cysteine desulfhydrase
MRSLTIAALRAALARIPMLPIVGGPTPIEPLPRLAAALDSRPRLFIKRDDAIPFGFGGNKIRKLAFVAARAQAEGADTLITAGAVQSNHARATASAAAKLGMHAVLVVNGGPSSGKPAGNALLDALLGAEVVYVGSRDERIPTMAAIAADLRARGRRPFEIPIGASTPLGALGLVRAVTELVEQMEPPDMIVHATSSGGTQAGIVAGCRLLGLSTRVIGMSADDDVGSIRAQIEANIEGIAELLGVSPSALSGPPALEIDDSFVGPGYGLSTEASREAIGLAARTDAIFLDPTYTGKAMAGLIGYVRQRRISDEASVVFWHTGGQPALFA